MQLVPLQPVYAQRVSVTLAGQACVLTLYQKSTGFFADLQVGGVTLFTSLLCRPFVRLVLQPYLGFVGDLVFIDTLGKDDPTWSGLGSRWLLAYLSPAEVAEFL